MREAHPLLVPAIAASQFAPPFMISGVAVALPALGADLGAGPVVAGFLVERWGWRAVFIAGGVTVLALLAPIHFMLRAQWRAPRAGAVHLPSTALVVVAMLALVGGAASLREGALGYGGV